LFGEHCAIRTGATRGPCAFAASAAEALLGTLSDAEKSSALFKVNDEEQRLRWANLPTGIFSRTGLRMGNLKPEQFNAVMFSRH